MAKKTCIQERVKANVKRKIRMIVFNPLYIGVFCIIVFFPCTLLYIKYLQALDYSQISGIVRLIVETDGVLIAFSGVIVGLFLRKFLEESEMAKVRLSSVHEKKRATIINFVACILMALIASIFFSLGAIITQSWDFTIQISIIFMFTGIIELFSMLVYAIGFDPEKENIQHKQERLKT